MNDNSIINTHHHIILPTITAYLCHMFTMAVAMTAMTTTTTRSSNLPNVNSSGKRVQASLMIVRRLVKWMLLPALLFRATTIRSVWIVVPARRGATNDNTTAAATVAVEAAAANSVTNNDDDARSPSPPRPANSSSNSESLSMSNVTIMTTTTTSITTMKIPIFYNLFVRPDADANETQRVQAMVVEQLSRRYVLPNVHGPIYVTSIGKELPSLVPSLVTSLSVVGDDNVVDTDDNNVVDVVLLNHHPGGGDEALTLHSLWRYCIDHPDRRVVYLHSKGSYHPSADNDRLRHFLTRGALSYQCAGRHYSSVGNVGGNILGNTTNTTNTTTPTPVVVRCSVCSTRFSPYPHPHTPGNMWAADCDYVSTLLDPQTFATVMDAASPRLNNKKKNQGVPPKWVVGNGRYASEHWIMSRSTAMPCDLYTETTYTWGYEGIPDGVVTATATAEATAEATNDRHNDDGRSSGNGDNFHLQPAPRFPWEVFATKPGSGSPLGGGVGGGWEHVTGLEHRLEEYRYLYNETPTRWLPPSTGKAVGGGNGCFAGGVDTVDGDVVTGNISSSNDGDHDHDDDDFRDAEDVTCSWWGWRMAAWAEEAHTMVVA